MGFQKKAPLSGSFCDEESTTWREIDDVLMQSLPKGSRLKDHLLLLLTCSWGCGSLKHLSHFHAHLVRLGLHRDRHVVDALLRNSFQLGHPRYARSLFDDNALEPKNIHLWNTMIRGFASTDRFEEAVGFYGLMRADGWFPNHITFPFVLKACRWLCDVEMGRRIHTQIVKSGLGRNLFVGTALVCLYVKRGGMVDARKVFDEMPVRSTASWTTIVGGYSNVGESEEALKLFWKSIQMGICPDSFTLVRILKACTRLGDLRSGERVQRYIDENGMGRTNVFVATALVDMYSKCGSMEKARKVFDGMPKKDEVSWNAIVSGYSSNGLPKEALSMFSLMQEERVKPDCYTLVGVLSACTKLGALDYGYSLSRLIGRNEFFCNPVLGTALIDMFSKCGCTSQAWEIFLAMRERDIIVWNSMVSGLAMSGHGRLSIALFAQMEKMGIRPCGDTFIGLLCSCTHSGLVDDGRRYFNSMSHVYKLTPRIEHHGCMVDLLARAGLLEEAHQLIMGMPMKANAIVWGALLSGCRMHRNSHLAELALRQLIALEPQNSGNYVLLSNIYSSLGKWEDAAKTRLVMKGKRIAKIPGCSWIEVEGFVHEFVAGDQSHPMSEMIYLKLKDLAKGLKELGYTPTTEVVLFDIEDEEKEHVVGEHSEKLAIAFGLISLQLGDLIRVVKNLRVCRDCHNAIKLISKLTGREIILRDTKRFHRFVDGKCSCNDYW